MAVADGVTSGVYRQEEGLQSNGHFMYLDSGLGYTCVCIYQNTLKAHLRLIPVFVNCVLRFL